MPLKAKSPQLVAREPNKPLGKAAQRPAGRPWCWGLRFKPTPAPLPPHPGGQTAGLSLPGYHEAQERMHAGRSGPADPSHATSVQRSGDHLASRGLPAVTSQHSAVSQQLERQELQLAPCSLMRNSRHRKSKAEGVPQRAPNSQVPPAVSGQNQAHLAQRTQLMCWLRENRNLWR